MIASLRSLKHSEMVKYMVSGACQAEKLMTKLRHFQFNSSHCRFCRALTTDVYEVRPGSQRIAVTIKSIKEVQMDKKRKVNVGRAVNSSYYFNQNVPCIVLQGDWLLDSTFKIGDVVDIETMHQAILLTKRSNEELQGHTVDREFLM